MRGNYVETFFHARAGLSQAPGIASIHPFAIGDVNRSPLNDIVTSGAMGIIGTGSSFTITIPNPVTVPMYFYCQYHHVWV